MFALFAFSRAKWQRFAEGILEREPFHEIKEVCNDRSMDIKDVFDRNVVGITVTGHGVWNFLCEIERFVLHFSPTTVATVSILLPKTLSTKFRNS